MSNLAGFIDGKASTGTEDPAGLVEDGTEMDGVWMKGTDPRAGLGCGLYF